MNAAGTIDHPMTHDPRLRHSPKQDPEMPTTTNTTTRSRTDANTPRRHRTRQIQLMPESLARSHARDDQSATPRAARDESDGRPGPARRLQRRAGRATLRARRALAMVVMQ